MELTGKTAIVTGSSRGIGRGIALALGGQGAAVVVVARSQHNVSERPTGLNPGEAQLTGQLPGTILQTCKELEGLGAQALAVSCDVTKEDQVELMVTQTLERFGRIDILVNNVGVYAPQHYLSIPPDRFNQIMNTNILGMYLPSKHVLPHMIEQRAGSIINIGSNTGVDGLRRDGTNFLYAISKAGVHRLTTFIGSEVEEYGISANILTMGMIVRTAGQADSRPDDDETPDMPWYAPDPELFSDAITFLAQQTAHTFTRQMVALKDFGKTWP